MAATQRAAAVDAGGDVTVGRAVSRVISANKRSESVSPWRAPARSAPSSYSSRGRSSITPLWANSRPAWSNGWVLGGVSAPVDAKRMWATNVALDFRGRLGEPRSASAAIGCLVTSGARAVKAAETGAVGLPPALVRQRVGRVQQPEGGAHGRGTAVMANRRHTSVTLAQFERGRGDLLLKPSVALGPVKRGRSGCLPGQNPWSSLVSRGSFDPESESDRRRTLRSGAPPGF